MQILCFSSNVNIAFRLCVINQSESSFREFKARSFRVHRGKRGTIRRNSSRLAFLTRFCLARVRLEPPTKFVRLPLLRLFVPRHFFLFFFFSIVPSFLSLSLSASILLSPEARTRVCTLRRCFVTGIQNNPRKSGERIRSELRSRGGPMTAGPFRVVEFFTVFSTDFSFFFY